VAAGAPTDRAWKAAKRFAVVLSAVLAFQLYVVTAATPLVSTVTLATVPAVEPIVVAEPARAITIAQAAQPVGRGWVGPVARNAATFAHQYRLRYQPPLEVAQAQEVELTEVVGSGKIHIADVAVLTPPAPVTIEYAGLTMHDDPSSRFQLNLDTRRRVIEVTVADQSNVLFEIDYRDRASDIHRIGVTPVLLGHRLEGNFHRVQGELTFPLVTPTFDAGRVTYTTVSNLDDNLLIRFDGGPYANLIAGREEDGATYLEVEIKVTERRVRMDLAGLYYVRPAVGAEMFFTTDSATSALTVDVETPRLLKYIESPTRVDITDPAYGNYVMRTDVSRLQVQWDGVGTAFELDFDHAYKDRGQANVLSRLLFVTPTEA